MLPIQNCDSCYYSHRFNSKIIVVLNFLILIPIFVMVAAARY